MKNRTILGLICIVIAGVTIFVVSPLINKASIGSVTAIKLSSNVQKGAEINESNIEKVKVPISALPSEYIKDEEKVVGKYASADLFEGDYLTTDKIQNNGNTAGDVFSSLNGNYYAVSITLDSFAAGLSGKLENGDIVSLCIDNSGSGNAIIPPELKYVKVITSTTSEGVERDNIETKEDGSSKAPATVTLLVNEKQLKMLVGYESNAKIHAALVYRGDDENSKNFLNIQEEYLNGGGRSE